MYIIKKHYKATATNLNFIGVVKDYYEGKAGKVLSIDDFPTKYMINEYGYPTLAGAKRGLKTARNLAEHENSFGHWNVTVDLIEVHKYV